MLFRSTISPCLALAFPIAPVLSPIPPQPSSPLTALPHTHHSLVQRAQRRRHYSSINSFLFALSYSLLLSPLISLSTMPSTAPSSRVHRRPANQQPRRSKKTALRLHFSTDSVTETDRPVTPRPASRSSVRTFYQTRVRLCQAAMH